jgi:rubrerythrin
MKEDKTMEILKNAILLEQKGQAFYAKVAQQATSKAVKRFFKMMADEEKKHIRALSEQFKAYQTSQKFDVAKFDNHQRSDVASEVLTRELKQEISAADFEAAAISAAMFMEENAIKLYSDREITATEPNEKALYGWLAKWETQHLNFLADIDKELTEQIWHDQNFWPF